MKDFLVNSTYFGVFLSLFTYCIGVWVNKKLKRAVFNPLIISVILCIAVLKLTDIDYQSFNASAKYLSYLLTPATVCLAIPLYEQLNLLKHNKAAVIAGIVSGVLASLCCVLLLSLLFGFDHAMYVTLLPKSVTTAIGMPLVEQLGGYPAIAAAVIITTGIIGNIFAEGFLRLIRVTEPIARGIAIGTSSHAFGTVRALELGEIEGAMSSLSIAVSGLITVVAASLFSLIM